MGKERLLTREDSDEQDEAWLSAFSWEEREREREGAYWIAAQTGKYLYEGNPPLVCYVNL